MVGRRALNLTRRNGVYYFRGFIPRQLQARISYLRATSVSQANRRGSSNQEMERIVAAIKSGDPLAAHQASVDHVRAAAKVALDYLRSKQDDAGTPREIATPIALKDPRIGR